MKLELKEYQEIAKEQLLDVIENAMIRHSKKSDKIFAISLASPTGSGKTIIMTSVVQTILYGNDAYGPVPDATILWVSDSPDLNEQTKRKMSMHSTDIKESQLVSVTNTLDQRTLDKGKVYFSNTQQLGKGATTFNQISDRRRYPIWDIISNTVREQREKFILIIDEAHRGVNAKGKTSGGTIVQKLMDGVKGNLPSPIVIGISATPERFIATMTQDSSRTLEQVQVPTLEVKKSGLIKDKLLVLHPDFVTEDDMSLLEAAVEKTKQVETSWKKYSEEQNEPDVVPLLVIQVPPKCTDEFYSSVVSKIKEKWPKITDDCIRHCTESHGAIAIGGTTRIKYISPPDIQDDPSVRVVLFKQALNTGWDCPRAEVMISFSAATDPTYVAQTIGRMVRTPLARRIGTDDSLNNVALYLPKFDADAVSSVVNGLNTGDDSVTSDVIINGLTIPRNQDVSDEVFAIIESLPSYSRASKIHKNDVNRMNKMVALLVAEIDKTAVKQARDLIVSTMKECSDQMADLESLEDNIRNVDVSLVEYEVVDGSVASEGETTSVPRAIEDINRQFRTAMRKLPDNSAMVYWVELCDLTGLKMKPKDAKIRVIALSNDEDTNEKLDVAAKKKIEEWQEKHKEKIKKSSDAKQVEFDEIAHQAKEPEQISVRLEHNMTVPESDNHLQKHIFSDKEGVPYSTGKGEFFDSTWEERVVKKELQKDTLKGWYRNGRGGEKSLSVPYLMEGKYHQSQPDLIFAHEVEGELVVDIYDPHNHSLSDTAYKWIGLAEYAKKHSDSYRHVKSVIEMGDLLWCLDLKADGIIEKIAEATNKPAIENLFKSEGSRCFD